MAETQAEFQAYLGFDGSWRIPKELLAAGHSLWRDRVALLPRGAELDARPVRPSVLTIIESAGLLGRF